MNTTNYNINFYDSCKNCKKEIKDEEFQSLNFGGLCYYCTIMYYNNGIINCDMCHNFSENWNNFDNLTVCNYCSRHVRNNIIYNNMNINKKNKLRLKILCQKTKEIGKTR